MLHETILIVEIIFVWCTERKQFTNSMYHLDSSKNFEDFICWTVLGESCKIFFLLHFLPSLPPKQHIQATLFSQRISVSLLFVFQWSLPFRFFADISLQTFFYVFGGSVLFYCGFFFRMAGHQFMQQWILVMLKVSSSLCTMESRTMGTV